VTLSDLCLARCLRWIRDPHHRQSFRFGFLAEVQRHPVAAEEDNSRSGELIVQHLIVALEGCRSSMCGPTRIEARLVDAPRACPPGRNHFRSMLAAFVANEDILIAVLLDAIPHLVEGPEDDVDVSPVRRSRDNQRNAFDF